MSRPKPNFWPGDRELVARVVDDLEEATDRCAALVQLPGRVQVARAEAERDHAVGRCSDALDERTEPLFLGRVDERLDRHVVARPRLREQLLHRPFRLCPGDRPPAPAGENLAGSVLRLLDVGLVERVYLEDRTRDRGRELPAEELGAEVVRVVQLDLADLAVGAVGRLIRCRYETTALLSGGFGKKLLYPQTESVEDSA